MGGELIVKAFGDLFNPYNVRRRFQIGGFPSESGGRIPGRSWTNTGESISAVIKAPNISRPLRIISCWC
jgi:hypothetical protein